MHQGLLKEKAGLLPDRLSYTNTAFLLENGDSLELEIIKKDLDVQIVPVNLSVCGV